jgi:hypothetical protein
MLRQGQFGGIWPRKKGAMFMLLLIKEVKVFLLKQQILDGDLCPFHCDTSETMDHLVYGCCHTKLVLHHMGIDLNGCLN